MLFRIRFITLVFLLIPILLILISCSQPDTSNTITITSSGWTATPTDIQLHNQLISEFEKQHPYIRVKHEIVTGNYWTKIFTQLAGGNLPDVFWADISFIRPLLAKQAVQDITPFIQTDDMDISDFYSSLLEPFMMEGKYYGLPNDACTLALFYNKDLFDKATLSYPDENWTWDNFLKAALKLTIDRNKDGIVDQWGIILPRRFDFWFPFIHQNGGEIIDRENPNNLQITSPVSLEAIQFYVDLSLKYHVSPSHGQASDLDTAKGFQLGKMAMMISGWWDLVDLGKYAPNLNYGIAPLPAGKNRVTGVFATATVMGKNTKHPKEAWELIKFMTGKEGQILRCKSGMAGPSRKSVTNALFRDKKNEMVFIHGFDYGQSLYGSYIGILLEECTNAYERSLLGQQSVKLAYLEAIQNYNKRIQN